MEAKKVVLSEDEIPRQWYNILADIKMNPPLGPDGKPIGMGAEGPTTGGYPKIATVVTADRPLLAQLVPGEGEVRFEAVRMEEL